MGRPGVHFRREGSKHADLQIDGAGAQRFGVLDRLWGKTQAGVWCCFDNGCDKRCGEQADKALVRPNSEGPCEGGQIEPVDMRAETVACVQGQRVIEGLQDLVSPDGLIGVMSSGQGSIANNLKGGQEVYRGSKAALNQYMRCYAVRHAGEARALVLVAPGWIRTALGGPDAPFTMEETVPQIVTMLIGQIGKPGLRYLDRMGETVPW
jgi:NAD(P)-dependent dehydrogenase (short-subunit alcohol dehydrogenase family)